MNKNHFVSFELAKQLKENGYPQNTEFYWWEDKNDEYTTRSELCFGKPIYLNDINVYAAPLSSELGEELRKYLLRNIWSSEIKEAIDNCGLMIDECDNRAKMWLYLRKNGLI